MRRALVVFLAAAPALGCGVERVAGDAGLDGASDGPHFTIEAGIPCDAGLSSAQLPSPPPNCAACPLTAPAPNAPCADDGLTCQYGADPRLGCNPLYECAGTSWRVSDFSAFAPCGPVYQGTACDDVDAGCGTPPLCLRDGGACAGAACTPFLTLAPGCPCSAADHAELQVCTGSFDLVCTDAGRFDGVGVPGLCGE